MFVLASRCAMVCREILQPAFSTRFRGLKQRPVRVYPEGMKTKTVAVACLLLACGESFQGDCGFEAVDITIPNEFTKSLVLAPCLRVSSQEVESACVVEPRACVDVLPGDRLRLWFPAGALCGADGELYPLDATDAPTPNLVYSSEPCP
jgi:hypothetical protein